jgi:hypothetical protein
MIHRDDMSGAGHVLHDECWITGNIFSHVVDDEPRPEIVKVARRRADDDANGFALVKRSLGIGANAPQH